jgi:integrase
MAKQKRGQNEGSLHQLKSGRWCGQVSADGKRISKTFDSQREVILWLRQTHKQVEDGLKFDGSKELLKPYMEGWLKSMESKLRPSTLTHYRSLAKNYIYPQLGKILLRELSPDRLQHVYDGWQDGGMSSYLLLKIQQVLHTCLDRAVRTGKLVKNSTDYVDKPEEPRIEKIIWNEDQISNFLQAVRKDENRSRIYALFHLAINSGMRQSELLGLKWSDIDWTRRTLKIERQLARLGDGMFAPLKTRESYRTIDLGSDTIEELRARARIQQRERVWAGNSWVENDLIFTTRTGDPIHPTNLLIHYFKPLMKKADVPQIRFHDLRHTAASHMLNMGIPPIVVSKRLGHSKISTTLDMYGHLIPGITSGTGQMMDDLMRAGEPIPVDLTTIHHE